MFSPGFAPRLLALHAAYVEVAASAPAARPLAAAILVRAGAGFRVAPREPAPAGETPWDEEAEGRRLADHNVCAGSCDEGANGNAHRRRASICGYNGDGNYGYMRRRSDACYLSLALLSPGYFDSKWCRGEVEAAKEAGVPIVPVYSGEDYGKKQITSLLDNNKDDPVKAVAVSAAFGENLLDANNGEHTDQVTQNLQEKIIERFLARPLGEFEA